MAIQLGPETVDAQGLPVVIWEEDRNLHAPGGAGRARVACFIKSDSAGVLQFVSAGWVRQGPCDTSTATSSGGAELYER